MNKKVIIITGVVVGIILILAIIINGNGLKDNEILSQNTEVEKLFNRLPYKFSVGNKNVAFEEGATPLELKEEFTASVELTEILVEVDPLVFIEQAVDSVLSQEQIQSQEEFFNFAVSFYPHQEENKISAVINLSGIPDDSVRAVEERIDFVIDEEEWGVEWYGQRISCRRGDVQAWQPMDQPCI